MTGGPAYIRDGAAPFREPGSRKPEEAFALLLTSGANPNAKAPDGTTLLHQAARAGNLDMIRALGAAKVDFTQKNADGVTAPDVHLPQPGVGMARERRLSAALITGEDTGTRSSTVLAVSLEGETNFEERTRDAQGAVTGTARHGFVLRTPELLRS